MLLANQNPSIAQFVKLQFIILILFLCFKTTRAQHTVTTSEGHAYT